MLADAIYRKRMSDTALSTDPSMDSIWIKIFIKEVKADHAAPAYID